MEGKMAEKRMFTKKITESDAFLDMPLSAQCLYFHLNMSADDFKLEADDLKMVTGGTNNLNEKEQMFVYIIHL